MATCSKKTTISFRHPVRIGFGPVKVWSPPPAMLYPCLRDIHAGSRLLSNRGVAFEEEPSVIYRDDNGIFGRPGQQEWLVPFRDSEGNLVVLMARRGTS